MSLKSHLPVLAALMTLSGLGYCGEKSISAEQRTRPIALFVSKGVEVSLVDSVKKHLSSECQLPVRVIMLPPDLTYQECVLKVTSMIASNDLCAVAMVQASDGIGDKQRKAVFAAKRTAILEIEPLRMSLPDHSPLREIVLESRVQKQALCCVGLAVGLNRCPYPRCCLLKTETLRDLDAKAMTFCPPCHGRFERVKNR